MGRRDDVSLVDERGAAELSGSTAHGPDHGRQPGVLVRVSGTTAHNAGLEALSVSAALLKERKTFESVKMLLVGTERLHA